MRWRMVVMWSFFLVCLWKHWMSDFVDEEMKISNKRLVFRLCADYPDYSALVDASSAIRNGDLEANSYLGWVGDGKRIDICFGISLCLFFYILKCTKIQMSFHLTLPEQAKPYFECAKQLSSNGNPHLSKWQWRCEFGLYTGFELHRSWTMRHYFFKTSECGWNTFMMHRCSSCWWSLSWQMYLRTWIPLFRMCATTCKSIWLCRCDFRSWFCRRYYSDSWEILWSYRWFILFFSLLESCTQEQWLNRTGI